MKIDCFAILLVGLLVSGRCAWADETKEDEAPPIPTEVDTKLPILPISLGSIGVVMVAVGAGFGWQADEEYDSYNETPTEKLADDVEKHSIAANVLIFTGTATVIGGVVWWWLWSKDESDDAPENDAKTEAAELRWRPEVGVAYAGAAVEF